MTTPVLLDVEIEKALLGLVTSGSFPIIEYDTNGTPSPKTFAGAVVSLQPEATAYPVGSGFELDSSNGRARRLRRAEWTWALVAHWEQRVSLEPFERARFVPSYIERDDSNGIDHRIEIRFAKASYGLSPRGQTSLAPSLLTSFKPGMAAMRAHWRVQVALLP